MKNPIILNILIKDHNNKNNIVGAVIDMHYSNIKEIINGSEIKTTVVYTVDNRAITILLPFKEVLDIYMNSRAIIGTYKEEVFDYLPNNWENFREDKSK